MYPTKWLPQMLPAASVASDLNPVTAFALCISDGAVT